MECKTRLESSAYVRYERHIELPEIGEQGQAKLLASKVLVVGAGGLGTPAAVYLTAAGVGHIGIVDDDTVRRSNLQRQILYKTTDEGLPKVECLARELKALNPETSLETIGERLAEGNARETIGRYDLVIDGSDNFETRYLLNDVCYELKKPLVSGAVLNFDGQVAVFKAYENDAQPCYRCLHPDIPDRNMVPSCTESAVLGPLVGVIGCLQATEAIKELVGLPGLAGALLTYSALNTHIEKVTLRKDPHCPTCK